ncbi:MAG: class I SAM-dependent methyltransferase [Burkholderiaceae bacterium]|nr:class I SAM-dependent methyltransferase [Burkholderiaceae bacterium]
MTVDDIPSPIDLRCWADAVEWEATAMAKRPWRTEFFSAISSAVAAAGQPAARVLELGAGPGFLARHLLETLPSIDYLALDFSPAMHRLAQQRLGPLASRTQFIERDFRAADWASGLGPVDVVVTHQAVHELRHKRHAAAWHRQVRRLLSPGGLYLVSDHFAGDGGMGNDALYMTVEEQRDALLSAGFPTVEQLLLKGGLVLHRAR